MCLVKELDSVLEYQSGHKVFMFSGAGDVIRPCNKRWMGDGDALWG